MEKKGHTILVTTRKKDITLDLLRLYKIKHIVISKIKPGKINLVLELIKRNFKFYKIAKKFKPDVTLGLMGATIGTTSPFIKAKKIVFWDTEISRISNAIVFRLVDVVVTPDCFESKVPGNQIKYPGYHELAYLHPKQFKPDSSILKELKIKKNEKFFILRFVSWHAAHDIKDRGFTNKIKFVKELEEHGRVFITSEPTLPKELKENKLPIPMHKLHHALAFSTLYIGESATIASECAVLGTPAIFLSTSKRGYTNEQESKYDLVYNFSDQEKAMKKALELIKDKNIKKEWKEKRDRMLKDKMDVTSFIIRIVEKFYKHHKHHQNILK